MALPPVFRGVARNVKRHTPRCVKNFWIVVAAGATEVGARPSVRYDLRRRDLLWAGFHIQDQGRSMPSYREAAPPRTQFSMLYRSLLESDELPLRSLISDERIAQIFAEQGISFGQEDDAVYTPAVTLWGLLSQVLFKEEQRSCLAAVVRIAALWQALGRTVSSTNTGAYCRARKQITGEVLRGISGEIASWALDQRGQTVDGGGQAAPPDAGIGPASEYAGGRLVIVDGFTVTAADTQANQAEYPQNPKQQAGLGFPILRGVLLTCLRTGLLLDADVGPYSGKGTGETALLWKLLDVLRPGDLLVADSYYCTYWLLAECRRRGVEVVMRNHHLREDAPAAARRLLKGQCIATWNCPPRPEWMEEATYETMPACLEVRLVQSRNEQAGQRTEKLTLATTLLDHKQYDAAWLAGLYRGRWRVELDLRASNARWGWTSCGPKRRRWCEPSCGRVCWFTTCSANPCSTPHNTAAAPAAA